jgi:hypothetical protein
LAFSRKLIPLTISILTLLSNVLIPQHTAITLIGASLCYERGRK